MLTKQLNAAATCQTCGCKHLPKVCASDGCLSHARQSGTVLSTLQTAPPPMRGPRRPCAPSVGPFLVDGHGWGAEGGGDWECRFDICTPLYMRKIDSQQEPAVWHRELSSGLCDLDKWDGEGREVQEKRDRCIHIADSLHYMGFPGGASGKEHACQRRRNKRHGFGPWVA